MDEFSSQIVIAGLISYCLEKLKKSSWFPWVSMETKRLNAFLGAIAALVATIGIQFQFDGSSGTLMISGLSLASLQHGLWDFAKQYFFQQVVYDSAVQKKNGVK